MTTDWRDVLATGERLLWEGQPDRGLILRPIEILLIPFSLLWGGFAIFWNVTAWTSGAGTEFQLFGMPFLLVGAYVIAGRFVHDIWLRRRTSYAVTDQRVVIRRVGLGGGVRSIDLVALPVLELHEDSSGRGTVRFENRSLFGGSGFDIWVPGLASSAQFLRIADARVVYAIIRRQRAG